VEPPPCQLFARAGISQPASQLPHPSALPAKHP